MRRDVVGRRRVSGGCGDCGEYTARIHRGRTGRYVRRCPYILCVTSSGVAGPLAARGGGQICRPFVLGFGNCRACLKYKSMLQPRILRIDTRCSCDALFLLHVNTYEIIQSEFSREFLKTIFACLPPLASAARCGPHPPQPPRYASGNISTPRSLRFPPPSFSRSPRPLRNPVVESAAGRGPGPIYKISYDLSKSKSFIRHDSNACWIHTITIKYKYKSDNKSIKL